MDARSRTPDITIQQIINDVRMVTGKFAYWFLVVALSFYESYIRYHTTLVFILSLVQHFPLGYLEAYPTLHMLSLVLNFVVGGFITYLVRFYTVTSIIIKIKIHSSCEIGDFIETHLCTLCVILRSPVLRVVCPR